ncbi:nuclear transport factor 2 family protein [Candidatus Gracilibacteria bacterium]|jgi:ketosteroid isomerase-like protein|nr:nuclear transport factor 2 family protein [Candidatus Gracilibacteria bacterium]NJM88305.1 nuclear transport factor 2 family protein [Hydrococcus sp. RU_2_2]NJP18033.1 nuclear transport factor 2 family protein [Hydrococcus sp. CRU_1_1]NJQ97187.1 nuclear transport factor 2 family protein [Hydrococcus sp. CSU_1_8]
MEENRQKTMEVAQKAFQYFKNGLATGQWQPFLEMLSDDFTFWFPIGKFHGLNVGKERAKEFFDYFNQAYPEGLSISLDRITSNETTVVFEFCDEGIMWGEPYKNRVAVSFDVRDDKICSYREYLGSDGKSN